MYVPSLPNAPKDLYQMLPDRMGLSYEVRQETAYRQHRQVAWLRASVACSLGAARNCGAQASSQNLGGSGLQEPTPGPQIRARAAPCRAAAASLRLGCRPSDAAALSALASADQGLNPVHPPPRPRSCFFPQDVWLTAKDGVKLHSWLCHPSPKPLAAAPTIVFFQAGLPSSPADREQHILPLPQWLLLLLQYDISWHALHVVLHSFLPPVRRTPATSRIASRT